MIGFSANGPSFELDNPKTAKPWFNLLGNGRLFLKISPTGEGYSYLAASPTSEAINLTRPPSEQLPTGRIIYLRDQDSGEIWSPTWQPVGRDPDSFRAIYDLGSLTVESETQGIRSRLNFFLARDELAEICRVRLENLSARKRNLTAFIYLDWGLDRDVPGFVQASGNSKRIIAVTGDRQNPGRLRRASFIEVNRPSASFDCQRQAFFGPPRSLGLPQALVEGKCSRSDLADQSGIAVLQLNLTLAPRATVDFRVLIGHIFPEETALTLTSVSRIADKISRSLASQAQINQAEEVTAGFFRGLSDRCQVKSPDSTFNRMINSWTKYQAWLEVQGVGSETNSQTSPWLEDYTQNLLGLLVSDRPSLKRRLEELLGRLDDDGRLLDRERLTGSQWLIAVVIEYLKETGETNWLREAISGVEERNVLSCLLRSLEGEYRHLETSDWRSLNQLILYQNLIEIIPILAAAGEPELSRKLQRHRERLTELILARRSTISQEPDGKIWLVLNGLIIGQSARKVLRAALKEPGSKKFSLENSLGAAISLRSQAWLGLALAKTGEGDALYRHYLANLPLTQSAKPSYQLEPFVYSRSIYPRSHPLAGQGKSSWSSNAAGWWLLVALKGILGVQPGPGGLRLDPCLPRDWRRVEVFRHWRGADYHIRIENPFRREKGVDRIVVDGVRLTGQVIKPFAAGAHYVEVVLG